MNEHTPSPLRTDERLSLEQQRAVLMLATRLQQEYDEGATLADLILIGQEAGLSREAVEEAYRQVLARPSEPLERKRLGKLLENELSAVHLTVVWVVATWAGVLLLPMMETLGMIGVAGTFLLFPVLTGVLVKRPLVAASHALAVALNLMIAFSVKFGLPQSAGGRADLIVFLIPIVLAFIVSSVHRYLTRPQDRPADLA